MLSDRCLSRLSCLSVTFEHCGQTVGRIKMKLGIQVGLGPGHIVLDGDPAPLTQRGTALPPIFGPYLLQPNGCMDQDVSWYGTRPRPRRLMLDGTPLSPPQKGPQFSLRGLCVRWRPSPLPKKGAEPPNFRPMFIVAKQLDGSRCHLARR